MEKVTRYSYALGSVEEIRSGRARRAPSLNELEIDPASQTKRGGGLFLPRFVAVYQEREIYNERGKKDPDRTKDFQEIMEEMMNLLCYLSKIKEDTNPESLIHIGYESKVFRDPKLVKLCVGDNLGRIGISKMGDLPNFAKKDTYLLDKIIDKANSFIIQDESPEETFQAIGPGIRKLENQRVYGLTGMEYLVLKVTLDAMSKSEKTNRNL